MRSRTFSLVLPLTVLLLSGCGSSNSTQPKSSASPRASVSSAPKASVTTPTNSLFVDPRFDLNPDGNATNLFTQTAYAGYWYAQVEITNISHSPVTVSATNYLLDSEGNTYQGTEVGTGLCAGAPPDWKATMNPKEYVSVGACFQLTDGTKLVKFWAKNDETGTPIFSIPLRETIASQG
jgi:hypothetical protein